MLMMMMMMDKMMVKMMIMMALLRKAVPYFTGKLFHRKAVPCFTGKFYFVSQKLLHESSQLDNRI